MQKVVKIVFFGEPVNHIGFITNIILVVNPIFLYNTIYCYEPKKPSYARAGYKKAHFACHTYGVWHAFNGGV